MTCETCGAPTAWVRGAELDAANESKRESFIESRVLRAKVEALLLAEEGAKEAFDVVVIQKRHLEAECRELRRSLKAAHDNIRRNARAA